MRYRIEKNNKYLKVSGIRLVYGDGGKITLPPRVEDLSFYWLDATTEASSWEDADMALLISNCVDGEVTSYRESND